MLELVFAVGLLVVVALSGAVVLVGRRSARRGSFPRVEQRWGDTQVVCPRCGRGNGVRAVECAGCGTSLER